MKPGKKWKPVPKNKCPLMTSYAVISDVHGNLEALYAVLREIEREKVDSILFLGGAESLTPPAEGLTVVKLGDGFAYAKGDWKGQLGLKPLPKAYRAVKES